MIISLLLCMLIGVGFSFVTLTLIVNVCKKYGLVDTPNWRKIHRVAVPRLGGLVFVPSVIVSMSVGMACMDYLQVLSYEAGISTFLMIMGTVLVYTIGIMDDVQELRATTKLLIQTVASLIFPFCNLMICNLHGFCGIYEMPLWVSYAFTVFVILLIVNAMNLIDGIDGLSSGLSIIMLSVLAVLYGMAGKLLFTLLCVSLIATILVFFCFNVFGKTGGKKIFMGDAGSLTLGYVIAYLVIKYQMPRNVEGDDSLKLLLSYSLVIIPTFDVIRVAISRKLAGKSMFSPDKSHIHHRIMSAGLSAHQTLVVLLGACVLFTVANVVMYQLGAGLTLIVLIDVLAFSLWHLLLSKRG